jgi:cell division transport system permease protein
MKRKFITFGRILHTGAINFIRNITLAVAAVAVMIVTLTIVLFSVIANASFTNTIAQITDKIDISVFLSDTTTEAQAQALTAAVKKLPEVKSIEYLNKETALKAYAKQNAGNTQLLAAISATNNPIPATIHIKLCRSKARPATVAAAKPSSTR